MIIEIIGVIGVLIGFWCLYKYMKDEYSNYDFSAMIWLGLFGVVLIFNTIAISVKRYNYRKLVVKKESFEKTLKTFREKGENNIENAAILKDVVDFNKYLEIQKFDNSTIFFDWYIDDRVEDLKPIE